MDIEKNSPKNEKNKHTTMVKKSPIYRIKVITYYKKSETNFSLTKSINSK